MASLFNCIIQFLKHNAVDGLLYFGVVFGFASCLFIFIRVIDLWHK